MPVDLPNLLLGLLAAAIPLAGLAWQLQRRASLAEREIALLGERLATAQLIAAAARPGKSTYADSSWAKELKYYW